MSQGEPGREDRDGVERREGGTVESEASRHRKGKWGTQAPACNWRVVDKRARRGWEETLPCLRTEDGKSSGASGLQFLNRRSGEVSAPSLDTVSPTWKCQV